MFRLNSQMRYITLAANTSRLNQVINRGRSVSLCPEYIDGQFYDLILIKLFGPRHSRLVIDYSLNNDINLSFAKLMQKACFAIVPQRKHAAVYDEGRRCPGDVIYSISFLK
jgi:hypothetical protein